MVKNQVNVKQKQEKREKSIYMRYIRIWKPRRPRNVIKRIKKNPVQQESDFFVIINTLSEFLLLTLQAIMGFRLNNLLLDNKI